jgi:hypothetical protein
MNRALVTTGRRRRVSICLSKYKTECYLKQDFYYLKTLGFENIFLHDFKLLINNFFFKYIFTIFYINYIFKFLLILLLE